MLTLRQRIFLIIGAVLASLALIIGAGYYLKNRPAGTVQKEEKTDQTVPAENITVPKIENKAEAKPAINTENSEDAYARQLAIVFAERFSSYSNQNDNKHIDDSLPLATLSMQSWMKKQALAQSADYQGVMTKVISSSVQSKDQDKAVIVFTAQQVQEKNIAGVNSIQKEIKQRKGRIELVKAENEWKINGMWWE